MLGLHTANVCFREGWPEAQPVPATADPAVPVDGMDVTPVAANEADGPAKPAGFFASMGQLGQAAMLTGAVAVTSAATVTGTVSLMNPEVRLAPDSELRIANDRPVPMTIDVGATMDGFVAELESIDDAARARWSTALATFDAALRDITLKVHVVGGPPPDGDIDRGNPPGEIATAVARLSEAVGKLEVAADRLVSASERAEAGALRVEASARTLDDAVQRRLVELRTVLDFFEDYLGSGSPLVKQVAEMVTKVESINTRLNDTNKVLGETQSLVNEISPRRNVRGSTQ